MRSLGFAFRMATKDARVFVHTFAFGNPTIIALAIVDSLTSDTDLFGTGPDAADAKNRGSAYISTHLFCFSLWFWIVGYIYINLNKDLKRDEEAPAPADAPPPDAPASQPLIAGQPPDDVTGDQTPPAETARHWWSPVTDAVSRAWDAVVAGVAWCAGWVSWAWHLLPPMARDIISRLFNPAFLGVLIGMIFLFAQPVRDFFIVKDAPLRIIGNTMSLLDQATVPLCLVIVGANMAKGPMKTRISNWAIFLGIVIRYLLLPAAFVSVIYLCYCYGLFGDDPMFYLILFIETSIRFPASHPQRNAARI